ncbi:MAG: SDR family NAD(P)-dependent oxidoreductase [Maricaulaceae bacterium]|jgi:NAD(P)-dependent dehydrogenase (short-subunit alcohol dehydrogenase family)
MEPHRRSIVVTGASTGIGCACAVELIARGFHVFAGVRSEADAAQLKEALGENASPLTIDVTKPETITAAAETVRAALSGETLAGLVNNAGISSAGPLLHLPIEEVEKVLDVNLVGVLRATQAFAPLLGADRSLSGPPGRIVMMSSQGGKIGYPFGGAYVAAKHGLEGLSASLRRELMVYGIDVIIIGPGAVATPIWDKAEKIDMSAYRETDYGPIVEGGGRGFIARGREGLPPERVARLVHRALTVRRPRVRYAIAKNPLVNWVLPRVLPARLVDRIIARIVGLKRLERK